MGTDAMISSTRRYATGPKIQSSAGAIVKKYQICHANNHKFPRKPLVAEVKR